MGTRNNINHFVHRCEESKQRKERSSRILVDVKAGIEHLAGKLQYLKAPKGHVPQAQLTPGSDEYVLDLLGTIEQKLLKLMEDLGGKDIQDVMKEMEDIDVSLQFDRYPVDTRISTQGGAPFDSESINCL